MIRGSASERCNHWANRAPTGVAYALLLVEGEAWIRAYLLVLFTFGEILRLLKATKFKTHSIFPQHLKTQTAFTLLENHAQKTLFEQPLSHIVPAIYQEQWLCNEHLKNRMSLIPLYLSFKG